MDHIKTTVINVHLFIFLLSYNYLTIQIHKMYLFDYYLLEIYTKKKKKRFKLNKQYFNPLVLFWCCLNIGACVNDDASYFQLHPVEFRKRKGLKGLCKHFLINHLKQYLFIFLVLFCSTCLKTTAHKSGKERTTYKSTTASQAEWKFPFSFKRMKSLL